MTMKGLFKVDLAGTTEKPTRADIQDPGLLFTEGENAKSWQKKSLDQKHLKPASENKSPEMFLFHPSIKSDSTRLKTWTKEHSNSPAVGLQNWPLYHHAKRTHKLLETAYIQIMQHHHMECAPPRLASSVLPAHTYRMAQFPKNKK